VPGTSVPLVARVTIDATPPILNLPADSTAEATGPSGAAVGYSATATDALDGPVPVTCSPASGSTFPLGTQTVHCSATDAHGNTATGMFTVTVQDTTPPSLTVPVDKTAEATSAAGAPVSFSASATDRVDGPVGVACSPSSGSTFALGTTTVRCSATDAHRNTGTGSFKVTVDDTTPPTLTLPADIAVKASSNSQTVVTYSASADDLVDGKVPVTCSPDSGSSFPVGTTTVNCSAKDTHQNTTSGHFAVKVSYAWTGFFQPIDNNPDQSGDPALATVWNSAKAGSTIPAKFGLGGNQALAVIAIGYPKSVKVACPSSAVTVDPIETYADSTSAGLVYDPSANQYVYSWKTTSTLAGTCQEPILRLADGITHYSFFKFTK
jgi:hypothetical protein